MRIIDARQGRPVGEFGSEGATWTDLGGTTGGTALGVMRIEPGGELGGHAATCEQLFIVVGGAGWVAGSDGERVDVAAGQAVLWAEGEFHESGSTWGMTVVIVQSNSFAV